jgi:hypothetical protein
LDTAQVIVVESQSDMRASDVLREVARIIDEREIQYGEFDVTAYRTAALQSIVHEERRSAEQWCLDMVCTKLGRIYSSPKHLDNYHDAIAYLAQAASLHQTPKEEIN